MPELNLKAVKKELQKLTDVAYVRSEMQRIANEVKNFDVRINLTPEAKGRLKVLENRFNHLKKRITEAQSQVDIEIKKFIHTLKTKQAGLSSFAKGKSFVKSKSKKKAKASAVKTSKKKTSRRSPSRKTSKS